MITFATNSGINTQASMYMLVAANRAYLLQAGAPALGPAFNGLAGLYNLRIESYANGIMYDPDQYSMQLVNLNTSYYYLATLNGSHGLYVTSLQEDGSLSTPTLVSSLISGMAFHYKVDNSRGINSTTSRRFTFCATAQMGSGNCLWNKVTSIVLTLSGSSRNSYLSQTMTDSVGWLW